MASSTSIGSSSGSNTGIVTGNPQNTGISSSLIGVSENPQSLASSSSINDQTSNAGIPLPPTTLRTVSIETAQPKTTHKISPVAFVPIAVLVILATAICLYIFVTSRKTNKNL